MADSRNSDVRLTKKDILTMVRMEGVGKVATDLATPECSQRSVFNKVKSVKEKYTKLIKNSTGPGKIKLEAFLQEEFIYPQKRETIKLQKNASMAIMEKSFADILQSKENEIRELRDQNNALKHDLECKSKLISDLEERIEDNGKLKKLRLSEEHYHEPSTKFSENLNEKDKEKHNDEEEKDADLKKKADEVASLRRQIIEMDYRYSLLKEKVQSESSDIVELFDEDINQYTPELEQCVQNLLSENVGAGHVGRVITEVLKLINKTPNKVPCRSMVYNMKMKHDSNVQTTQNEGMSDSSDDI